MVCCHSPSGEQRRQFVSRHETEGGTAGTHPLESRGGRVSAGTKQREGRLALTSWRAEEAGCQQARNRGRDGWHSQPGEQRRQGVSRHETEGGTAGTHILESRGGRVSAGTKQREGRLALTIWRAEEAGCQQARNRGRDGWHSQSGEQRRQGVSRHETEGGTAGTHDLESRGGRVSAGTKRREGRLALTFWRAEEAGCQQARNGGRDGWHSPP